MSLNVQMTEKNATLARGEQSTGTDLLHTFVVMCPTCKHPYASCFTGFEYILSGLAVCAGSLATQMCKPVEYRVFPLPLNALSMDIVLNEKRYRGVLYETEREEEA